MKKYLIGFVLGFGVHLLMGSMSQVDNNSRELEQIAREISRSNGYLSNISRSLDRLDDPVSGSQFRIKVQK